MRGLKMWGPGECLALQSRSARAGRQRARFNRRAIVVGIAVWLVAFQAFGQETPRQERDPLSTTPTTAPSTLAPSTLPSVTAAQYPLELLGLLAPNAQRGGVTLAPALTIYEEYNDNIFA